MVHHPPKTSKFLILSMSPLTVLAWVYREKPFEKPMSPLSVKELPYAEALGEASALRSSS